MTDNLLLPLSLDRLVDTDGAPLGGGKVFVYDAGTTTPRDVFADNALTVPVANPIIADAGGYIEPRYIGTGDYRLVIADANDVTIKTADNLSGALATSAFEDDEALPATPVIVRSANYTVQEGDKGRVIHADATGANVTITLLDATVAGDNFRITVKHTGTANEVIVATSGGDTLDGATSFTLDSQYEAITCVSDGANWSIVGDAQIFTAPLPVGVILPYGGTSAPIGWFLCNGSAISRTGNSALFTAIGTTFGAGNGSTTFNLPDMGGRVPAGRQWPATRLTPGGSGINGAILGATGGSQTHALTVAQLAAHNHGASGLSTGSAGNHDHELNVRAWPVTPDASASDPDRISRGGNTGGTGADRDAIDNDGAHTHPIFGNTANTGSGAAHQNTQPTIVLNYIIKAT